MNTRVISAAEAAREALDQLLSSSKDYFVIGEGVPDPKACFGTTKGLFEKYPEQVFDMPVSENGMTGVCVGAALHGMKPIMIHMRQDFLLYAMDQLVNNAAKWYSMFGGQRSVPMVVKAFTGRGWGAGHQHAQNLQVLFAHIPGLKVVCPSSAENAKGLLIAAAQDPNPVMVLEHRWVHNLLGEVPEEMYETQIGKAKVVQEGTDVTLVSWSYSVTECRRAAGLLGKFGVSAEVIDLQSLRPLDTGTVYRSAKKTGRLFVVDDSWEFCGMSAEIITQMVERHVDFKESPRRITAPSYYPSSTPALTKTYYPNYVRIFNAVGGFFGLSMADDLDELPHDIPSKDYVGPF